MLMTKNNVILTEEQKKKKDKEVFRVIVLLCVVGVIGLLLFAGIFGLIFQGIKHTEEYATAKDYLMQTDEFIALGADETDIHMKSGNVSMDAGEGDALFVFWVKGKTFTVVCHLEDGVWSACEQCSSYQSILDHHYITEDEI